MRLPMTARYRVSTLSALALASTLLAGCAVEPIAPKAPLMSGFAESPYLPTEAQKALVGVNDGTYTFTINPSQDQSLSLGASHLAIPANAICDLATSSYGMAYWNDACTPQTAPLTITAMVTNAGTDHPRVDFQPALRFSPSAQVNLYLSVSDQATLNNTRVVKYCTETSCIDESVYDEALRSYVDVEHFVVFRRIKHFSGYLVSSFADGDDVPNSNF
jgi:hypothetical protein